MHLHPLLAVPLGLPVPKSTYMPPLRLNPACARAQHINIMPPLSAARPCLRVHVQEWLDGGSLSRVVCHQMISGGVYTYKDALRWCIDIAEGLNYLHTARPMVRSTQQHDAAGTVGDCCESGEMGDGAAGRAVQEVQRNRQGRTGDRRRRARAFVVYAEQLQAVPSCTGAVHVSPCAMLLRNTLCCDVP